MGQKLGGFSAYHFLLLRNNDKIIFQYQMTVFSQIKFKFHADSLKILEELGLLVLKVTCL